ncbi:MAG: pyridoxamine 5'-phosphate oxidase family protein [Cyclobacteriaceae bacterium]
MSTFEKSELNRVVRGPKRATYDRSDVYKILDDHYICHLTYLFNGTPMAIPTGYGRLNDTIYLHGAVANRSLNALLDASQVSVTVTHLDGLVLARSAFHHSFNYRSAVIFGKPKLIEDDVEKMKALEIITNNIIPDRWDEVRQPNEKELKITKVIALDITQASAKIRTGPPVDDTEDYQLPIWAGVLPLSSQYETPIPDDQNLRNVEISDAVIKAKFNN